MTSQWLLQEVGTITEKSIETIERKFVSLNHNQWTWKPNESTWSLQEITAHLNEYARFYHTTIQERIEKTIFRTPKELFTSSPLGRSAWISMKLGKANNVKRKFNTTKPYNPTINTQLITGNELETFRAGQKELLEIILTSSTVNLRKVKIPLSISKLIRFRLGDALLYVVYHNERHIQQAINLMKMPQFPKK